MEFRSAMPTDALLVETAVADVRRYWMSIRPQSPCDFSGTRDDILALDYLHYEGIPWGMDGASLVWGNVLQKTGLFSWVVSDCGDFLLRSEDIPTKMIWPFPRVLEIHNSSTPQFGKYQWLTQEVVVQYLAGDADLDTEAAAVLLPLIELEYDDFVYRTGLALDCLRKKFGGPEVPVV